MSLITCRKRFQDIPIAHRLPHHDGHCADIHGHNLAIEVVFVASELGMNNFVLDFGNMHFLKEFIADKLDHKLLIQEDDLAFRNVLGYIDHLVSLIVLPSVSTEGIAHWLLNTFAQMTHQHTDGRVTVSEVTVWEDSKNSATARVAV